MFGDRGYRRLPSSESGWQEMESQVPRASFRIRGRRITFLPGSHWRELVANLAIGLLLRLQHDVIYLHASGVAIGWGRRGVLFVGAKGAGKTTTALGLASRGHAFLGDELVGVRQGILELVPVWRTISKREGPCATAVERALAPLSLARRRYSEGESRTMLPASQLFVTAKTAALRAIAFLDGFSAAPQLTAVPSSLDMASKLTPVTSTLWGRSPTSRAFALVRLLGSVACYRLTLGPPDMTSMLLETAFEHGD